LAEGDDPDAPSPAQLQLVVDGRHGRMYNLNATGVTIIGREETSDVVVTDPAASRQHAEVRADGDVFTLIDLGSTNGTLIDGARVTQQVLDDGDQIVIGETVLEFRTT
jgi:pSer/pThr/pTyr-binding forkhead associated (FHA) protein